MKSDDSIKFLNIYNINCTRFEKKYWQTRKLLTIDINIKQKQIFIL